VGFSLRNWVVLYLIFSGFCLYYTLYLILLFDRSLLGFQFLHKFALLEEHYNLCLAFGIDGISLSFLFLTAFIFPLCYLAAINTTFKQKTFLFYLFLLELLLFLTFTVIDLFYFYVFFESILIPMFIIIGH